MYAETADGRKISYEDRETIFEKMKVACPALSDWQARQHTNRIWMGGWDVVLFANRPATAEELAALENLDGRPPIQVAIEWQPYSRLNDGFVMTEDD